MRIGFDNEKYITMQADRIHQRISEFGGKLYLEFGGKLKVTSTHITKSSLHNAFISNSVRFSFATSQIGHKKASKIGILFGIVRFRISDIEAQIYMTKITNSLIDTSSVNLSSMDKNQLSTQVPLFNLLM